MATYRPLPEFLTIKESPIHGLGVFAVSNIAPGVNLGLSHIFLADAELPEHRVIRTPLGGFINHSSDPNCVKLINSTNDRWEIYTARAIDPGEELTIEYSLYTIQ